MKNFSLNIINEDKSEKILFQNSTIGKYVNNKFALYNRQSENHEWERVYKENAYRVPFGGEWTTTLSYGTPPIQPLRSFIINDDMIDTSTNSMTVSNIDTSSGSITIRPGTASGIALTQMRSRQEMETQYGVSHADHVRAHQEVIQQQMAYENEMARRAAQSVADRQRQLEERNRTRRPWDRVRGLFRD